MGEGLRDTGQGRKEGKKYGGLRVLLFESGILLWVDE
jgi:hypothetical protein